MATTRIGMAIVFSHSLLITLFLLLNPVSSTTTETTTLTTTPTPPGGDFVTASCKAATNTRLCTMTLAPYHRDLKNKPADAVTTMMAFSQAKAIEMTYYVHELALKVKKPGNHHTPDLDKALVECVGVYNNTAEGMQAVYIKMSEQDAHHGADLKKFQDELDIKLNGFIGETERCQNLMKAVPDSPIKAEFLERTKTSEVDDFILTAYQLFNDLRHQKKNASV